MVMASAMLGWALAAGCGGPSEPALDPVAGRYRQVALDDAALPALLVQVGTVVTTVEAGYFDIERPSSVGRFGAFARSIRTRDTQLGFDTGGRLGVTRGSLVVEGRTVRFAPQFAPGLPAEIAGTLDGPTLTIMVDGRRYVYRRE